MVRESASSDRQLAALEPENIKAQIISTTLENRRLEMAILLCCDKIKEKIIKFMSYTKKNIFHRPTVSRKL